MPQEICWQEVAVHRLREFCLGLLVPSQIAFQKIDIVIKVAFHKGQTLLCGWERPNVIEGEGAAQGHIPLRGHDAIECRSKAVHFHGKPVVTNLVTWNGPRYLVGLPP